MFKLLPDEAKIKISKEYASRRAAMFLMAFIAVLVIGLVGLLPTFILSSIKKSELNSTVNALANTQNAKNSKVSEQWLADINQKLQILSPALDNVRPVEFIAKAIEEKIPGIILTGFQWLADKDGNSLTLSGIAKNRETLLNFQNSLNSSENFSNVALPVSNLAKDKNISFQIKLKNKK